MTDVYVILSEELIDNRIERSISVYSSLEKAKILLENKLDKLGKYNLIKCTIDNIPTKFSDDYKMVNIDKLNLLN